MTINNPALFVAGLWDWAILDGCFGETTIKPSDIDGCTERNGHTLYIETKQPGASIPRGQDIMFSTWQHVDKNTVIVVWGRTNEAQRMKVYYPNGAVKEFDTDNEGLRKVVAAWYQYANTNPRTRTK